MSTPGLFARGPQPTPQTLNASSSGHHTSRRPPRRSNLPVNGTPLDRVQSARSAGSHQLSSANALVSDRQSLDKLSVQLKNLCQPSQLNFQNLKKAMSEVRRLQDILQQSSSQQDSLTNQKLAQIHVDLLAVLELMAANIDKIEFPFSVRDVKKLFEGIGAVVGARTTIFETPGARACALNYLRVVHAKLLNHAPLLDLASAKPSAVLSILNAISRGWKIGVIDPVDPRACALIATLPGIASAWKEEDLKLKDLGKSFVQLSSIMAFTTIPARSPEGQAIRAVFNRLANFFGKLSGHLGMAEVDDKTAAICISNIRGTFSNALRFGYFTPDELAPAQGLLMDQLAFLVQPNHKQLPSPLPLARAAALLAMTQLDRPMTKQPSKADRVNGSERYDDDASSSFDEDTSTTTATSTATATTTTAPVATATPATATTPITGISVTTSETLHKRQRASLMATTPKNIIATVSRNGNFDILFDSAEHAGDSGLKALFSEGKAKQLEAITTFGPFLQAVWDTERTRLGEVLDSMATTLAHQKEPGAHRQWLGALQQTFDVSDGVHGQIEVLLNHIDAIARAQSREREKEDAEEMSSPAPRPGDAQKAAAPTTDGRSERSLIALNAGALKRLNLNDKDDLKVFFAHALVAHATNDAPVPKEIGALEIPLNKPNANGELGIKVSGLIQQYRQASVEDRVRLQDQLALDLQRLGSTGRMRSGEHGPRALKASPVQTPSSMEEATHPSPVERLQGAEDQKALPDPTARPPVVMWFVAHALFGISIGLYLFRIASKPLPSAGNAFLQLNKFPPGHLEFRRAERSRWVAANRPNLYAHSNSVRTRTEMEMNLVNAVAEYTELLAAIPNEGTSFVWDAALVESQSKACTDVEISMQQILMCGLLIVLAVRFFERRMNRS